MKNVFSGAIISVMFVLLSCSKEKINGNGPVVTESRTISGFTAISAEGSSRVNITQGNAFRVDVKGYSNLIPYYETRLVNNMLHLGYKPGVNVKHDNIEVFFTLPVLDGIHLSGSGDIRTSGAFNGNNLLEAGIEGLGNIFFSSGTTQQFNSTIAGSGNVSTGAPRSLPPRLLAVVPSFLADSRHDSLILLQMVISEEMAFFFGRTLRARII
ncbi:MAG: GIN domain-containing protein [Chitinophagaceae bacterium]